MTSEGTPTREQLEAAIRAQEGLRATLGDDIVDATIAALEAQLAHLTDVSQQRKVVTVLFTDVVGSTRLMTGRDPEETMAIMDSALARLAAPVRAHGGRVTRFMGDGFMAVFGLPTARENDPEMAIRAGLGIVDTAHALAPDLESEHGISGFTVRVGINTGLVVTGGVTEAEDTIMGDPVNLAARMESAAAPGGVLISRDTLQVVRGLFEVDDGREIEAKGFATPVVGYHVLGRVTDQAQFHTRGVEGLEIQMVGRHAELQALVDAGEAVSGSGTLRAVTLVGQAGLGKSRLLEEFEARVDQAGTLWLEARATPETAALPYAVIRDLVERRFGIHSDDEPEVVRERLVAGVASDLGDDPQGEQKARFIGQMLGYDFTADPEVRASLATPQHIRNRGAKYLTEVVRALARSRPTTLVIEDLHWADAGSLDVLEVLLDGLADHRVLVVAAARPSLAEHRPGWGAGDRHEWIHLHPLSDALSEELVDTALRRVADCPRSLRQRLIEHAGGNPYYLEETLRMLIDDGVIVTSETGWTIDRKRLAALRIPVTLTGVIQARLEGLPQAERATLQQASVVGRVFWDAIVEHLARADADPPAVPEMLDALGAREMVRRNPTSTFAQSSEYLFHHEILRGVAYESVLLRVRRTYHSLVADWLIAHRGVRAVEITGLIAEHLERAGRSREAFEYFSEAAEGAIAAYAVETADRFYERALALAPPEDTARRFTLLLGREKTLLARGRRAEQAEVLDELAATAPDARAAATVGIRRAWFWFYTGNLTGAADAARAAVEHAVVSADRSVEAKARAALAFALLGIGEHGAARSEGESALLLAGETGDASAEMSAHNSLGLVALQQSEYSAARRHLTAYLEAARAQGNREHEIFAGNNVGVVEATIGNYPAARTQFARVRKIAFDVGDHTSEASSLVNLAWMAASLREWSGARDLAEQAIARARDLGYADVAAEGQVWLGHALLGLDEPGAALAAYSEAVERREALGQSALAAEARAGQARAAMAAGDLEVAAAHATRIADHLDGGGTLAGAWEPWRVQLTCVEVFRAVGDPRADPWLQRTHSALIAESQRIGDPADRRMFLERVPWHREILRLAREDG